MDQHEARSRDILACIGDSSRFRIVLSLLEHERCVTELATAVGLSQSCTTRHLQYLEREGLVQGLRQGKRVVFRLRSERARIRELLAWVTSAPPEALLERVSGADLHADGPGRPVGARSRLARGGSRPKPRARVPELAPDDDAGSRGPGHGSDPPSRESKGDSGRGRPEPGAPVDGAGAPSALDSDGFEPSGRAGDMEDWLL